jgi:hypothetical protein
VDVTSAAVDLPAALLVSGDTASMPIQRIRFFSTGSPPQGGSLRTGAGGMVGRALALVVGGVIVVTALFVSALVFSLLLVAGVTVGGIFWWKTRGVRKRLRERMAQMQRAQAPGTRSAADDSSRVLEGDFIREADGRPGRTRT